MKKIPFTLFILLQLHCKPRNDSQNKSKDNQGQTYDIIESNQEQKKTPVENTPQEETELNTNTKDKSTAALDHHKQAKVGIHWQKKCEAQLLESTGQQAWGLFSYSGWVDLGQHCLTEQNLFWIGPRASEDQNMLATPASDDIIAEVKDYAKRWEDIKGLNTNDRDGRQFEYVHWKKNDDTIVVTKRVFMNNPTQQPWRKLVDDFYEIMKPLKN